MRHFEKNSLRRAIRKLRRREDGVTLVELLLGLVIAALFSGIILTVFLSGTLGFRLTNDTSSLRAEADYMIASVMNDLNETKFDAVSETGGVYTFHALSDPRLSSEGIIYREAGYTDTGTTLSSTVFTSSNQDVALQNVHVSVIDAIAESRDGQTYYTSGSIEISITLTPLNDATNAKTFTSTIPF